jgi:hypothetical protein
MYCYISKCIYLFNYLLSTVKINYKIVRNILNSVAHVYFCFRYNIGVIYWIIKGKERNMIMYRNWEKEEKRKGSERRNEKGTREQRE